MDEVAIKKHIQLWQQILAFITHTQAPHDWTSPKYGITAQQRQKWRQLWQLASQGPGSPDPDPQGSWCSWGSWGSQGSQGTQDP
jgi:hypothetical protein